MKRNRIRFKKKLVGGNSSKFRRILQIWKRKRRIAERRGEAFMVMQNEA